jgi:hypothetical protein
MTTPSTADLIERYGEPDDISGDTSGSDNHDRVAWALAALTVFHQATMHSDPPPLTGQWEGTDAESALGDLIADTLHLATFVGLDPDDILGSACSHFYAEVGRGYES